MEQSASEAWSLRAFMLRLHDDLTPPPGRIQVGGTSWNGSTSLIEAVYADTATLPRLERDNLELLEASIRELESLDDVEDSTTLDGFRVALDEALSRAASREGCVRGGGIRRACRERGRTPVR